MKNRIILITVFLTCVLSSCSRTECASKRPILDVLTGEWKSFKFPMDEGDSYCLCKENEVFLEHYHVIGESYQELKVKYDNVFKEAVYERRDSLYIPNIEEDDSGESWRGTKKDYAYTNGDQLIRLSYYIDSDQTCKVFVYKRSNVGQLKLRLNSIKESFSNFRNTVAIDSV